MSKFHFDSLAGTIKRNSDGVSVQSVTGYNKWGVFDDAIQKKNGQELLISMEAKEIYDKRAAENIFCYGPYFWGIAVQKAQALLA